MARKTSKVPQLSPDKLIKALQTLEGLRIDESSKRMIASVLKAAANPDAESPIEAIKMLPPARQQNATVTAMASRLIRSRVMERAAEEINSLSDAEWEALQDGEEA